MTVTTSSRKNYNYLALRGNPTDDMEYVENFELDPVVAYTPAINDAMLEKVHKQNMDYYMNNGMTEAEAMAKANNNKSIAMNNIKALLKKNGM